MKPICANCKLFFRPKKNGFYFEEGMPGGSTLGPGPSIPDQELTPGREEWGPYKLWVGDLYECPGCQAQIVTGFSSDCLAEHYQSDYKAVANHFKPKIRVCDC